MKRIKTYGVLAGLMVIGLTLNAQQTTSPASPASTIPDSYSEQDSQVLDSPGESAALTSEETEATKEEALWAALRNAQDSGEFDTNETTDAQTETDTMLLAQADVVADENAESTEAADTNSVDVLEAPEVMEDPEADGAEEDAEPLIDSEAATVVIPLIVMDEVPLMDAIRNLARQAMINYMVDPRVPYGQAGEDGIVTPQPILSIRWENVTAEQALVGVLNNYNLQLVEDPKAKIFQVKVKDPAAPDPLVTQIIQLKYASPTNVVRSIQSSFVDKRSKVVADVRTSKIVVVTTEKEMVEVEKMVEELDVPTRQVLIEGRIIETTANPKTVKGIDWSGTLGAQQVTFGNNVNGGEGGRYSQTFATNVLGGITTTFGPNNLLQNPGVLLDTASGFNPSTGFLDADGVSATLHFLNTHADSKEIATPRAVTLDNESARLEVTRAYPIFKQTAGTQNTPGGSEVTYTNLGMILDVTPRISANDTVNLKVVPEVSSLFGVAKKRVSGLESEADIYDIRKIETRVLIPSGNTLVMGGLLRDRTNNQNVKVPILGDIPGLGLLFRKDFKERDKVNMIVFITPTIVEDSDFQPTPTDFLNTKFEEADDEEWGAWDSGKKKDWSRRND